MHPREFITALLAHDPTRRPTAPEARWHAWLTWPVPLLPMSLYQMQAPIQLARGSFRSLQQSMVQQPHLPLVQQSNLGYCVGSNSACSLSCAAMPLLVPLSGSASSRSPTSSSSSIASFTFESFSTPPFVIVSSAASPLTPPVHSIDVAPAGKDTPIKQHCGAGTAQPDLICNDRQRSKHDGAGTGCTTHAQHDSGARSQHEGTPDIYMPARVKKRPRGSASPERSASTGRAFPTEPLSSGDPSSDSWMSTRAARSYVFAPLHVLNHRTICCADETLSK